MTEQQTPEQRAMEAAEVLAAEGAPVTARAVRERSGVRMTVAADAARAWNEREAQAQAVPEPPAAVEARFAALWREAVAVARSEFAEARTGWQAKVEQVEAERDQARAEAAAIRDQVAAERDQAAADAASVSEALAEQRSRADKSEARAEAVEGERDRLVSERDRLLAERDELRDAIRKQKD